VRAAIRRASGTSVRDVQTFVDHLGARHGFAAENIGIVAQSVGAVLVATWVHDYAPPIRAMVLASPAFRVKLYVPLALPVLRLMRKLRGNFFVTSYVKAKFLTRDPSRIASYDSDPLVARSISVNVLLGLQQASDRIVADAQAITVPTQLLISGADYVVYREPQNTFFDRLGSVQKERHLLHGFLHDTLGERDRSLAVERVRGFLARMFAAPRTRANLLDADRHGFTREEADALAAPLPAWTPRGLYWSATRAKPSFRRVSVGWHPARPCDRLRLRQHARLHLPRRGRRTNAARAHHRSHVSRRDRMAWHPSAQTRRRSIAVRRGGAASGGGCAGACRRRRRRTWTLRARRGGRDGAPTRFDSAARLQRSQRRARPRVDPRQGAFRYRALRGRRRV
jgi:esterase/lipase